MLSLGNVFEWTAPRVSALHFEEGDFHLVRFHGQHPLNNAVGFNASPNIVRLQKSGLRGEVFGLDSEEFDHGDFGSPFVSCR
jgi:hypothetical protein